MSGTANQAVKVVDARNDDFRRVPELYREVIAPSFPPDELETEEELMRGLRSGRSRVLIAVSQDDAILGGAVGDYFPRSNVMLLAYLAALPGCRGKGVGSALLRAARQAWTAELNPRFIALEVEDPREFTGSAEHGDPVARVRFYERHGVRTLPIPYLQPALGPDTARVPGLMLMVLGGVGNSSSARTVDGRQVTAFLVEYFETFEGPTRPDDAEFRLLLAACARPGGLPLMLAEELPSFAGRGGMLPL